MISAELTELFSHYVEEHLGLHFPKDRAEDLERALFQVSADLGFQDPEACIRTFLASSAIRVQQLEVLASYLTVGETYFFRDKRSFDILRDQILPDLISARRQTGRILRIWSAGCATGEEPYSMAILLRSLLPDFQEWNISIIGTDINPAFLRKAAKGIYGEWSFRDVPSWVKEGFFIKRGKGHFELRPEIRKCVNFFYHNLAEDVYPSLTNGTNAIDIIFCRNVLMYFAESGRRRSIGKFYQCLVDGGWLILSPVETFAAPVPCLKPLSAGSHLYRKASAECEKPEGKAPGPLPSGMPAEDSRPEQVVHPGAHPFPPLAGISVPPAVPGRISMAEEDPYAMALELCRRGAYAQAEAKLVPLAGEKNNNGAALALLARIYANRGRLPEALEFCQRAIKADKLNPVYQYLLSTIQLEMGLEDESKTSLGRTLYLDPDFALAHFASGNLARRRGMKKEAARHFKNALSVLRSYGPGDMVPESGGITAGRLVEIISRTLQEEASE